MAELLVDVFGAKEITATSIMTFSNKESAVEVVSIQILISIVEPSQWHDDCLVEL